MSQKAIHYFLIRTASGKQDFMAKYFNPPLKSKYVRGAKTSKKTSKSKKNISRKNKI